MTAEPVVSIANVPDPVFSEGDSVGITGMRGTFKFISRQRNTRTGDEWVNVAEELKGKAGTFNRVRSFNPERVFAKRK